MPPHAEAPNNSTLMALVSPLTLDLAIVVPSHPFLTQAPNFPRACLPRPYMNNGDSSSHRSSCSSPSAGEVICTSMPQ